MLQKIFKVLVFSNDLYFLSKLISLFILILELFRSLLISFRYLETFQQLISLLKVFTLQLVLLHKLRKLLLALQRPHVRRSGAS